MTILIIGAIVPAFSKTLNPITKILILDADFKIIKTLSTSSEIETFSQHWQHKKELPPSENPPGQYKIDIHSHESNTRYLYNSNGTARLLTKKMTPEYQITDFTLFNKVLGIVK